MGSQLVPTAQSKLQELNPTGLIASCGGHLYEPYEDRNELIDLCERVSPSWSQTPNISNNFLKSLNSSIDVIIPKTLSMQCKNLK